MRDQLQAKPKLSSLLLLTIAVLFTHWMAFFNEGIFAEDAGLLPTLIYNDWIAIADMFSSAGVHVFTYYVWPMAFAGNVFFLKSIVIVGVYFIALLSYLLASKSGFFRSESLWCSQYSRSCCRSPQSRLFLHIRYTFLPMPFFCWLRICFCQLNGCAEGTTISSARWQFAFISLHLRSTPCWCSTPLVSRSSMRCG